jgi:sulfotransferase family protein
MYDFGKHQAIAIGGIGGSGTRILADLLISAGVNMGDDLNGASDNLLSALLFNRRCILSDPRSVFERIARIFYRRMSGDMEFSPSDIELVDQLAREERQQHDRTFLEGRKALLQVAVHTHPAAGRWGWKLPTVHVIMDRFMEIDPAIKYIHMSRSGLDMAYSKNQNQLETWGPILLNRNVEIGPRDSLSYWCAVHRRMAEIAMSYPARILQVSFEKLCADPENTIRDVLSFCCINISDEEVRIFAKKIIAPASIGRHEQHDLTGLRAEDVKYALDTQ